MDTKAYSRFEKEQRRRGLYKSKLTNLQTVQRKQTQDIGLLIYIIHSHPSILRPPSRTSPAHLSPPLQPNPNHLVGIIPIPLGGPLALILANIPVTVFWPPPLLTTGRLVLGAADGFLDAPAA